jgi:hypothetical protein
MQGGGQGEEDQLAREPQIREQLRRKDCQTHAGPTSEEIAVKQATVACKAEAKGKKIRWPTSRKYVKNCITTALKEHPTMNIDEVLRGVNVKTLRVHQRPEWGCEGMTSGRATGC